MAEKKYELIKEGNMYRIRALKDFYCYYGRNKSGYGKMIHKGDLGGLIEGEHNLPQEGNCWIGYNVEMHGNSFCINDEDCDI